MRMNFAKGISAIVVAIFVVGTSIAGDAVKSGLKPGETVMPFDVADITGPNKGKTLCYRCGYGDAPVVCVFARKTSEPLANLVKKIDAKIGENDSLKSFVVIMSRDGEKTTEALQKLAKDAGLKNVPLTMMGEKDGPPDYEISADSDVTVLMWNEGKVKSGYGFKGELTDKDIETILSGIPKLLKN